MQLHIYWVPIFQGGLSLVMLASNDIFALINYMSFVQWLSVGGSIAALIYLRWKRPDLHRPIKVCAVLCVLAAAIHT